MIFCNDCKDSGEYCECCGRPIDVGPGLLSLIVLYERTQTGLTSVHNERSGVHNERPEQAAI